MIPGLTMIFPSGIFVKGIESTLPPETVCKIHSLYYIFFLRTTIKDRIEIEYINSYAGAAPFPG